MSNPSKVKGTKAETKVARYLSNHGFPTERKALAGSADKGDLRMYLPSGREVTLEVKAGEQTHNYSRSLMRKWREQALVEGDNSGTMAILMVVRAHRRFVDTEVWIPKLWANGYVGWSMVYIDEFVDVCKDLEES